MKGTPWSRLTLSVLLLMPLVLTACDGEVSLPTSLPSISRSSGDGVSVPTVPSLLPSQTASRSPKPTETETEPPSTSTAPPATETTTETQTETETTTSSTTQTETTTSATTATETSTTTRTETESAASSPPGDGSASPVGDDVDDEGSAAPWALIALLAVVAVGGGLLLMRRRSGEVSVQDAYLAGATIRDRVSAEVGREGPLPVPLLLDELDAADLTIRNARAAATGEDLVRLDQLVVAVAAVRSGVEASTASAGGAHAADSEGDLLRALAQLNATLGDLAPGAPRA